MRADGMPASAGKYKFFARDPDGLEIVSEDQPFGLVDYANTYGPDEVVELFRCWLAEQMAAERVAARRARFKVVD